MNLNEWAIKHGIPFEAVEDLRREFGTVQERNTPLNPRSDESEAAIQTRVRLEGSRLGLRLFRNNVGATLTDTGSYIRYGLANESQAMNNKIKSSDLIGIRPVLITSEHIGQVIGQFVARECKAGYWNYKDNDHEKAQLKFLELIASLGGDAAFAIGEGTL